MTPPVAAETAPSCAAQAEMVPGEEGAEPVRSQAWVMTPEEGEAATVLSLTGLEARNVPAAISTAAAKVGEGNTWLRVSAVLPIGPKERIPLVVSGIPFPLK